MDLNGWSFVLSVIGLALGFVSAYPQLRDGTTRVIRIGADGANRMLLRLNAQADFFIAYPSALIAYVAKSAFILGAIFLFTVIFLRPGSPTQLPLPSWLQMSLALATTFAVGNIGGDLLNILRLVVSRAKRMHEGQSSVG